MIEHARTARTRIRFVGAPTPNGCRWCGKEQRVHGNTYSRSVGGHLWVVPTDAQRKARMHSRSR